MARICYNCRMDNIRIRRIEAYLKTAKTSSLKELMEKFGVSSATIHRDAAELSRRGSAHRVGGGLVYAGGDEEKILSPSYGDRIVSNRSLKMAAAQKAVALVEDGDIVFLDSSTTVYEIALLLCRRDFDNLTVVTNAIPVMHLFRKFPPHWSLIGLGGNFDPQLNSILGVAAISQLSRCAVGKAFVSAFGLDDDSATTNHERQAELLRKVIAASAKNYLVVDSTKNGRRGLYRIAGRSAFDAIVTDGV